MREEYEVELKSLSPDFLIEMGESEMKTCMHWGLACDDGWYEPLKKFLIKVDALNKRLKEVKFVASQIKEKWGTIHIYWNLLEENKGDLFNREIGDYDKYKEEVKEFENYLSELEEETAITCEVCGKVQNPLKQTRGWIQYICDDCYEKWLKRSVWNK